MENRPCQQAEISADPYDLLSLTLGAYLNLTSQLASDLAVAASIGEASRPTMWAALSQPSVGKDAVLYWVLPLMGALCRLQSWKETNAFATTLPVRRVLTSFTLGQQLAMEVYSNLLAALAMADVMGLDVPPLGAISPDE